MFLRWMFGVVLLVACQPTSLVAQEAMELPDEVRKEMNFLVGDWTFTAKENGKSTSGFYSTRWASGGTCLTMTFRSNTHNSTGLSSWDPVTNEIVENWTGPSTGRLELRYQIKSDSEWEGTILTWPLPVPNECIQLFDMLIGGSRGSYHSFIFNIPSLVARRFRVSERVGTVFFNTNFSL